ncbi:MAG: thioredoxin family protein [Saprospiraceae bacterium]|nr:thioredoxin family protein [Saprospiraceae bacterium]
MALTESNMLSLGTKAPDFSLLDTISGKETHLIDIQSDKATVIMFTCNHCPYVLHINDVLVNFSNEYMEKGVSFVAISSNDIINYPQDSPDKMKELAQAEGYPFPYLYDPTQEVAKAYDAACTPDFYVFDKDLLLKYRGRFCPSRPKTNIPVTGIDVRNALDAIINHQEVDPKQYPSAGCNIKWLK